jgi:type IV pilus assembly protein PilB
MALKLGELLLKAQLVNQQQLGKALEEQKASGGKLGEVMQRLGYVTEDDIIECLSHQFGVPSINLRHFEVDEAVARLVPVDLARKYNVIPVNKTGATLTLAMADPTNIFAMDEITFMTGYRVEPVVSSEEAIREAIDRYFGSSREMELKRVMEDIATSDETALELLDEEDELEAAGLAEASEEAPVVRLVNIVLTDAIKRGASDIHVEPYEKMFRVRYRVDGLLYEVMTPPLKLKDAIVSRLKVLAKLDIAEKRLPQDGRIKMKFKVEGRTKDLDFRVSVLPTLFGEKIVLRLLDKENLRLDMTKLGFEKSSLKKFEDAILQPYGMVLVTGPTGSGKTNTLYSALGRVNTPDVNIITAEDPVEFNLPGINQVQMKEAIGLNFAAALRSFLRQDPNIILVGEIRDFETAEIAIKAALTGHLVLSTLHTNDAPSTISRLMNMGIEPFLVATSVNLIAAQRLVRASARSKEESTPAQALSASGFHQGKAQRFGNKGRCDCGNTGYRTHRTVEVMEC